MDAFDNCCALMPPEIKALLAEYPEAEELRMRCGQLPSVLIGGRERKIGAKQVCEEQILSVLERATGASVHSVSASLCNGYISYKGLRIGVCGQAVVRDGQVTGFRKYSSVSVRIPHQMQVLPEDVLQGLMRELSSTLIVAPPGVGKTSALRELVRTASESNIRVALADERGEVSGVDNCFSLGPCTDVISHMPKSEAALMLLRTMNPDMIAMDEITSASDVDAVADISGCGVAVFATAHGRDREDMLRRPVYRKMFDKGIFTKLMRISLVNGKREYNLERIL